MKTLFKIIQPDNDQKKGKPIIIDIFVTLCHNIEIIPITLHPPTLCCIEQEQFSKMYSFLGKPLNLEKKLTREENHKNTDIII